MCRMADLLNNTQYRQKAQRFIALALCIFFLTTTLLSAGYLLTHAHHVHDHNAQGGGCATCENIHATTNLLKTFTLALTSIAIPVRANVVFVSLLRTNQFWIRIDSLVKCKVRMND